MVKTKNRVLITGGSGYIGSRLALHLADVGYAVTPLCYPKAPEDCHWCNQMEQVIVGDVRDEAFLQELALHQFDIVIHLVSLDHHQSAKNPEFVASVNITPTWSLLDIFSRAGLKKFIYFSTMQVYGILPNENIDESYNPNTTNGYALTHLIGEELCRHYNHNSDTECRVVRLSNSYGAPIFAENNCWWLVVNDLCRMAHLDGEIVLQSDGTPVRDFIHGWDVVRAVEAIITTTEQHLIYNVSSGTTMSIMELANAVRSVYTSRYCRSIDIKATQMKSDAPFGTYTIDNSLLKSIGYAPQWDLERGINDLFDFLERQ